MHAALAVALAAGAGRRQARAPTWWAPRARNAREAVHGLPWRGARLTADKWFRGGTLSGIDSTISTMEGGTRCAVTAATPHAPRPSIDQARRRGKPTIQPGPPGRQRPELPGGPMHTSQPQHVPVPTPEQDRN